MGYFLIALLIGAVVLAYFLRKWARENTIKSCKGCEVVDEGITEWQLDSHWNEGGAPVPIEKAKKSRTKKTEPKKEPKKVTRKPRKPKG